VAIELVNINAAATQPAPPPEIPLTSASVVTITGSWGTFEYRVDGHPDSIRGIGYNALTKTLTPNLRAARFDRDFAAIKATGANTIVGWDEAEFDDLLMDRAAAHGLGVILPFELRATWPYDNPQVRQQLLDAITVRVERYKSSPALRVWGLGNETLHGIGDMRGRRAQAFAAFLVQAADLVHTLDAAHPVVYRDAEDVYMEPVYKALQASGGDTRPWFIYGMNFFTPRIENALTKGPERVLEHPLLISEFGPVGLRVADRPAGYSRLWNTIRSHQGTVLGGCAYVWTTAGPEPLDRGFGLTNEAGVPMDGSVAALSSLFASDQAEERQQL